MTDLFSEKAMDWDGRDTIRELSAGNGASILSSRRTPWSRKQEECPVLLASAPRT
jgi:hypothetical protein